MCLIFELLNRRAVTAISFGFAEINNLQIVTVVLPVAISYLGFNLTARLIDIRIFWITYEAFYAVKYPDAYTARIYVGELPVSPFSGIQARLEEATDVSSKKSLTFVQFVTSLIIATAAVGPMIFSIYACIRIFLLYGVGHALSWIVLVLVVFLAAVTMNYYSASPQGSIEIL